MQCLGDVLQAVPDEENRTLATVPGQTLEESAEATVPGKDQTFRDKKRKQLEFIRNKCFCASRRTIDKRTSPIMR